MKISIEFSPFKKRIMGRICRECAGLIDSINNQDWNYNCLAETIERLRQEFFKQFPHPNDYDKDGIRDKCFKAVDALYDLNNEIPEKEERKRIASKYVACVLEIFQRYYDIHCGD